jgi:hypothetical protein
MPVDSSIEAAAAAERLLLAFGRAGVLSSRAIAAGEVETLLRLLGLLSVTALLRGLANKRLIEL